MFEIFFAEENVGDDFEILEGEGFWGSFFSEVDSVLLEELL